MKPKLSIVICTYNRAQSLKDCLDSLSKQSFPNFEVIVVDGGSTNDTKEIISKYSKNYTGKFKKLRSCEPLARQKEGSPRASNYKKLQIKTIVFQEKELARARDRGWREAKGEIVSFIDDDVVTSPDWAKSLVEIFANNPDIGGISGPTIVPKEVLGKRDVFVFYNESHPERSEGSGEGNSNQRGSSAVAFGDRLRMTLIHCLGKFWNNFFLEGKMYEVGRIFKSGAWSPGSNFPNSLSIKSLQDVDYLEACNMSLQRQLIAKVNGFDYGFRGTAEWCEVDLAMKVKKLGYRLVFSSKVRVDHNISQFGVYSRRAAARQRMENFFRFYFRHIFKLQADYIFKFLTYVLFLNIYWTYKAMTTRNFDWLGGWVGTVTGLTRCSTRQKCLISN